MIAYFCMLLAWCSNTNEVHKLEKIKRVEILVFGTLKCVGFFFPSPVASSGSAAGGWEGSPEQKAPLVASDSSSSGGSDSEEDPGENKAECSPKTPANKATAPSR